MKTLERYIRRAKARPYVVKTGTWRREPIDAPWGDYRRLVLSMNRLCKGHPFLYQWPIVEWPESLDIFGMDVYPASAPKGTVFAW